jgi:hypothetical protein
MSTGRMPCAFSSRTLDASIDGGRPYRRRQPLPWRCPPAGVRDAGWSRIRRTHRAGSTCRPRCWCRSAALFAFRLAPRARTVRTMSCRSPMLRARRSILVTVNTSPGWRKSSTVRSASSPHAACLDGIPILIERGTGTTLCSKIGLSQPRLTMRAVIFVPHGDAVQ